MRPNRLTRVEVGAIVPGGAVEGARRVSYVRGEAKSEVVVVIRGEIWTRL